MLNIKDSYCTVFQPECKGKFTACNISTGKKDREGNWTNMNWRAKFCGKNQDVVEKQRIKILSGTVETRKYEDKWYTDVIIFDWEPVDIKPKETEQVPGTIIENDSELPF